MTSLPNRVEFNGEEYIRVKIYDKDEEFTYLEDEEGNRKKMPNDMFDAEAMSEEQMEAILESKFN